MTDAQKMHVQIIVALKQGEPNAYGSSINEQKFAVPLPRSAADIAKMVEDQIVALVGTWADATMTTVNLLAETTSGKAVAVRKPKAVEEVVEAITDAPQ